jgi:hypothetical protein
MTHGIVGGDRGEDADQEPLALELLLAAPDKIGVLAMGQTPELPLGEAQREAGRGPQIEPALPPG